MISGASTGWRWFPVNNQRRWLPGQTSLLPLVSFVKKSVFSRGVLILAYFLWEHVHSSITLLSSSYLATHVARMKTQLRHWSLCYRRQQAIRLFLDRLRLSQLNFGDPRAFQWFESVLLSANRRPDSFRVLSAVALHSYAGSAIHACALSPCQPQSRSINIS